MIERIANAFDQATRSRQIGPGDGRLQLQHISFGSLYVDLGFLPLIAVAAWEGRDTLARFMSFLADSLAVISGLRPSTEIPPAHRSAFESLAAPVARGNAVQVNLFLVGDNQNRIEIGPELAQTILSAVARPRSPSGYSQDYLPSDGYREIPLERQGIRESTVTRSDNLVFRGDDDLKPMKSSGTAIVADGNWFVRPEGLAGILIPARFKRNFTLDPVALYLVEGTVQYSGERPASFEVERVLSRSS